MSARHSLKCITALTIAVLLVLLSGCGETLPGGSTTSGDDAPAGIYTNATQDTSSTTSTAPRYTMPTQISNPLTVPHIAQNPNFPTGCESVSTVMMLQYWGVDITVNDFIDNHLLCGRSPYGQGAEFLGDDPRKVFLGNPRSEDGWGCYAPTIVSAIRSIPQASSLVVEELYNVPLSTLCRDYIDEGIPVVIWATISMGKASPGKQWKLADTGVMFTDWVLPMHALVLVGYDDTYYYFNDPMTSAPAHKYTKIAAETAYSALGQQAVLVKP